MSTALLPNMRLLNRLYDQLTERSRLKYRLSRIETDVLGFLREHPDKDTAKEITRLRFLPKANVSGAVDSLLSKGLLSAKRDESDRRLVHLRLTEKVEEMLQSIRNDEKAFGNTLFEGFSKEDMEIWQKLSARMSDNAERALKEN